MSLSSLPASGSRHIWTYMNLKLYRGTSVIYENVHGDWLILLISDASSVKISIRWISLLVQNLYRGVSARIMVRMYLSLSNSAEGPHHKSMLAKSLGIKSVLPKKPCPKSFRHRASWTGYIWNIDLILDFIKFPHYLQFSAYHEAPQTEYNPDPWCQRVWRRLATPVLDLLWIVPWWLQGENTKNSV